MANITRTAALTVTSKLTATEMQEFLTDVPAGAEITFSHQQGDRRDPREENLIRRGSPDRGPLFFNN